MREPKRSDNLNYKGEGGDLQYGVEVSSRFSFTVKKGWICLNLSLSVEKGGKTSISSCSIERRGRICVRAQ